MKLAGTVLVILAACDAGVPPPTKPPVPPPTPPQPTVSTPQAACIIATSAGVLAFVGMPDARRSCGPRIEPDEIVLVFPLDVTHAMPDHDCLRNPVRATLGNPWVDDSVNVATHGEICYELADKHVTFDLQVAGTPVRGQVPLLGVMGGD